MRSPVPMNLTGRPVTLRMPSAAPPRASPSIFVSTSAGERQPGVERLGDLHRLLAGHGVDDEQRLGRRHGAADADELVHHRLVDMKPAGGVEDHDVDARAGVRPRRPDRADLERRRPDRAGCGPRCRPGRRAGPAGRRPRAGRRRRPPAAACALLASRTASLAAVVVLPEPCRPTSITTAGRALERSWCRSPPEHRRRARRGRS